MMTRIINRRTLFVGEAFGSRLPHADQYCISSAIVSLLPSAQAEAESKIAQLPGVEIRAREGLKLILVLEGESSGAVGSLLARIAVMDGVISANMVFEHTESLDKTGA